MTSGLGVTERYNKVMRPPQAKNEEMEAQVGANQNRLGSVRDSAGTNVMIMSASRSAP